MFILRTLAWGALLLTLTLVIGPYLTIFFDASFPRMDIGWMRYLGMITGAAGATLAVFAGIYLIVPGLSRSAPYEAGGSFCLAGPYTYIRNPFMLAVILMLWGEALVMSRLSLLLYASLCTGLLHAWVVFFEEPALRGAFTDAYADYHRRVPRWFPRLVRYRPARSKVRH